MSERVSVTSVTQAFIFTIIIIRQIMFWWETWSIQVTFLFALKQVLLNVSVFTVDLTFTWMCFPLSSILSLPFPLINMWSVLNEFSVWVDLLFRESDAGNYIVSSWLHQHTFTLKLMVCNWNFSGQDWIEMKFRAPSEDHLMQMFFELCILFHRKSGLSLLSALFPYQFYYCYHSWKCSTFMPLRAYAVWTRGTNCILYLMMMDIHWNSCGKETLRPLWLLRSCLTLFHLQVIKVPSDTFTSMLCDDDTVPLIAC